MDSKISGFVIRAAAILAAGAYCQAVLAGQEIHGAGATFPAPVYAAWSAEYQRSTGVRIMFDAVGSGQGIERIRSIKPGQLKLSGAVLADIYQGRIRKWNDAPIRALNPTLALPNANITVVHRSDPSDRGRRKGQ